MFLLYRKPIFTKIGLSGEKRGNGVLSLGLMGLMRLMRQDDWRTMSHKSHTSHKSQWRLAYLFGLFRDFVLIMLFVIILHNSILAIKTEELQYPKTGVLK